MYRPERDEVPEPPYIKFEDECPPGWMAVRLVGPSGHRAFRLEGLTKHWKPRHMLLLWELLQDVIADEEMDREVPNLSVVRAESDLRHAFSAARGEASQSARPVAAPVRLVGR